MLTVYSEKHALRNATSELFGGQLVTPFECPARVEHILGRLRQVSLGEIVAPQSFGLDPVRRVHATEFLEFLERCWERWVAAGYPGEALPTVWPSRAMPQTRIPDQIDAMLGCYALSGETSITDGTWEAACASVDVALTAQAAIAAGAGSAFALCRPPGHHAASDMYGGFCFINNAAVAAQAFIDQGAARVSVLDVDFHHGNGTQEIFYQRSDVQYLSLHGDPDQTYPHFLGYADERGAGTGAGFNFNYPLPRGTEYPAWSEALDAACTEIGRYAPDALVVSLGVDTFERDPISFFRLTSEDFLRYGQVIGKLRLPTLFVMEGGYAVEEIGINTVNVLEGFLS